jgi:hypothetical protein
MTTRRRTPLRRFTGAVAALALTLAGLTAAATPARANNDDLARFVIGATTLFIIGKAIQDSQRHQHRPPPAYHPVKPVNPGHAHRPDYRPEVHRPHRPEPRYLPAACEIRVGRNGGSYYPERCLRREGVVAGLPQRCAVRIEGRNGTRIAYEGDCLRRAGFDDRRRYRY